MPPEIMQQLKFVLCLFIITKNMGILRTDFYVLLAIILVLGVWPVLIFNH